jgi:pimeloyl-ACP methyl ester carboxylesterase
LRMATDSFLPPITVREYGTKGPVVVLLHGGPGAAGYMAPVARELAGEFRVLEPFQRGSGDAPLTVARHIDDLHRVIESRCGNTQPSLVGHSWGAMLALAYAAEHPNRLEALVLIGCGTFDTGTRAQLEATRTERINGDLRKRLDALEREYASPDERLRAMGRLYRQIDSYDLIACEDETVSCDAQAHIETWNDMLRLQAEGVHPAAFANIYLPVIMLHGAYDPHPGRLIRDGLKHYMPQLEYVEFERCGHYPWLERAAMQDFHSTLRKWLTQPTRC